MSEHSLSLPPEVTSPRLAREWVLRELGGWGDRDSRHAVVLLVSELVTNAVVHARSPVTVAMTQADGQVRAQVHDESSTPPTPRQQRTDRPGGRGLHLLDSLAADWGVESAGTGKDVWFTIRDSDRG